MSFTKPGKAAVVIDGQFGSTGKGLIAAFLARHCGECDIATTNASANAGHTTVDGARKFVTFHLPTFAVMQTGCTAYINAGAIINPGLLFDELDKVGVARGRVIIHPRAAVITEDDIKAEMRDDSAQTGLASTRKGVGTALANKVLRRASLAGNTPELKEMIGTLNLNQAMEKGARVVVEVPQGFSLGLNSGLSYPHCTSRDVTVAQGLADACIHPSFLGEVMMTLRTYPIRVGNIIAADGIVQGYSGPCYADQREISFRDLGVPEELTTVTKRVRRIFTWSDMQYKHACEVNRPTQVFLNFVNYLASHTKLDQLVAKMKAIGYPATYLGVGPDIADVYANHPEDHAKIALRLHDKGWAA